MNTRIRLVFILFTVWFILVAARLWVLQVVHNENYIQKAEKNRTRRVFLPAPRGKICDRNGFVLADNKVNKQLVAQGTLIKDKDVLAKKLQELLLLSRSYIDFKLNEAAYKPFIPSIVVKNLDQQDLVKVLESYPEIHGLDVYPAPRRVYVDGNALAHIIGYIGEVTQEDLEKGYRWNGIIGKYGIEKKCDGIIRGKHGYKILLVDNRGRLVDMIEEQPSEKGSDIVLTIDYRLQNELYNLLRNKKGVGILIKPKTGEIIAMVSVPSFDSNRFISPVKQKFVEDIFSNKSKPLLNRAVQGVYPPGSVFKVMVGMAGLYKGIIKYETLFHCDGKYVLGDTTFRCWKKRGHGWVDLKNALKYSCNEYFYQLGAKVGREGIVNIAERFGLGNKTGIDIQGEKKGVINYEGQWYKGDTINLSIGHGRILVTPIQVACMFCGLVNDGIIYKPFVVKAKEIDGMEVQTKPELLKSAGLNKGYYRAIRDGLYRAVNQSGGTANNAKIEDMLIAGKTGTVELDPENQEKNVVWFAGFAPFHSPEIVAVVMIEGGESGGHDAAPIAGKILRKWKELYKDVSDKQKQTN